MKRGWLTSPRLNPIQRKGSLLVLRSGVCVVVVVSALLNAGCGSRSSDATGRAISTLGRTAQRSRAPVSAAQGASTTQAPYHGSIGSDRGRWEKRGKAKVEFTGICLRHRPPASKIRVHPLRRMVLFQYQLPAQAVVSHCPVTMLTVEASSGASVHFKSMPPVLVSGPVGIGRVFGLGPGRVRLRVRAENAGRVQGPPSDVKFYIRP